MDDTPHLPATRSMTGFAALPGAGHGHEWTWELRAVNGRGLDLRLRLPDWLPGLEAPLRKALSAAIARGNVTLVLRISREAGEGAPALSAQGLERALAMLAEINARARAHGLELAAPTAAEVALMRGVSETAPPAADTTALSASLLAQLPELIAAFNAMRAAEGGELARVLLGQLDQVEALIAAARAASARRHTAQREALARNLARILDNTEGADPDRLAQELALIAVRSDVTEEIDRLEAHVAAARALLAQPGPQGRKLDFLMQEFNREANTLASKAQFSDLTQVGLDLKHVIDQMREQVQNVE